MDHIVQYGNLKYPEEHGLGVITGEVESTVVRGNSRDEAQDAYDQENYAEYNRCHLGGRPVG